MISIETAALEQAIDIAVLADFQTDRIGAHERRVLASLSKLDADLILLTGDYLQVEPGKRPALRTEFETAWLEAGIDPPLGVFAVQGNTDPASWPKLFAELDVTLLDDAPAESQALSDVGIELLGLSLDESFRTSSRRLPGIDSPSSRATELTEREPFRIVFGHGPDFALGLEGADLMVAGHTHGGQVQLPFVGPLITFSHVPRSWASGMTSMPDGSTLVVSRGTGMERGHAPRMRFLCPPELVSIRLHPRLPL
jgi:predicted MPP superfamily phosphohydrolase